MGLGWPKAVATRGLDSLQVETKRPLALELDGQFPQDSPEVLDGMGLAFLRPRELPLLHVERPRLSMLIRGSDSAPVKGVGEAFVVGVHRDLLPLFHRDFDDADPVVLEEHLRGIRGYFEDVPSQDRCNCSHPCHISRLIGCPSRKGASILFATRVTTMGSHRE